LEDKNYSLAYYVIQSDAVEKEGRGGVFSADVSAFLRRHDAAIASMNICFVILISGCIKF